MHKKDKNCESTKTKPVDSENDYTIFESVALSRKLYQQIGREKRIATLVHENHFTNAYQQQHYGLIIMLHIITVC